LHYGRVKIKIETIVVIKTKDDVASLIPEFAGVISTVSHVHLLFACAASVQTPFVVAESLLSPTQSGQRLI